MKNNLYEAYIDWRETMHSFQEDILGEGEADFAVWDAADHVARDDFNLFLASRVLDPVSFSEMKAMEIKYDSEY